MKKGGIKFPWLQGREQCNILTAEAEIIEHVWQYRCPGQQILGNVCLSQTLNDNSH